MRPGFEIVPKSDASGKFELIVRRIDTSEPVKVVVTKLTLERLWARADKCNVWELPSSIYDVDLSDDIYHFGASVELRRGAQLFNHRVPTGVVVR